MTIQTITHKHANIYLIGEGNRYLLFDCGWQDSFPVIKKALRGFGVTFEQIVGVFVSHFHPDHAGTVELLRRHGVRPLMLERQTAYIDRLNEFFAAQKNDPNGAYAPLNPNDIEPLTLESVRQLLSDNGIDGEILYTPGHSEDSISLIIGGSAVVGDLQPYDREESWAALRARGAVNIYAAHWATIMEE
jgi:glyoxylase-like metal-dependent hydrolase (beta-lactamase superfamily II)